MSYDFNKPWVKKGMEINFLHLKKYRTMILKYCTDLNCEFCVSLQPYNISLCTAFSIASSQQDVK